MWSQGYSGCTQVVWSQGCLQVWVRSILDPWSRCTSWLPCGWVGSRDTFWPMRHVWWWVLLPGQDRQNFLFLCVGVTTFWCHQLGFWNQSHGAVPLDDLWWIMSYAQGIKLCSHSPWDGLRCLFQRHNAAYLDYWIQKTEEIPRDRRNHSYWEYNYFKEKMSVGSASAPSINRLFLRNSDLPVNSKVYSLG